MRDLAVNRLRTGLRHFGRGCAANTFIALAVLTVPSAQADAQRLAPVAVTVQHAMALRSQRTLGPAARATVIKATVWGAAAGAVAGGIVTLLEGLSGTNCAGSTCSGGTHPARNLGIGAAFGAVTGAIIGFQRS